ncbi:MAG: hypothetical protein JWO91_1562 [Acidobacteriaceae bacterium]|nr:hypothetical protein [Acidobacteriaceae bacterium]
MSTVAQSVKISSSQRLSTLLRLEVPEVWIRFLLALVGLILAFAAALFSTVTREAGNLWATLVFASAALLLAVVVGLTTVPYLMKRVAGGRIRDAFDYEVTRAGIIFVGVVLLIGVAALNTGNNLLYIIVAAMMAAIVVSGVASAIVLRSLELDVRLPEQIFAGQPVQGRILLRNRRRRLPSFSVNVVARQNAKTSKRWQWLPSTFAWPPGRAPEDQWIKLPDRKLRRVTLKSGSSIFQGSAYFPYLPPSSELRADLELRFDRRGRYQQESFGLTTRFPFAFLAKTRRVAWTREIIVYPRLQPEGELFEILPLIRGEIEAFERGRGSELYRIREYVPDDSARHVDWKATAKSGSLKVREFSREDERKLRIVFANPSSTMIARQDYESAVSLAASLAWHLKATNTNIRFLSQECNETTDLTRFLAYLAIVEPKASGSILESLPAADGYTVIVTAQPRAQIPTSLWTSSHVVFIANQQKQI